ncbi:MAG: hypothetical protein LBE74_10265 [Treponema sp.]|nr:hypothetical protein [Treponema sp.]
MVKEILNNGKEFLIPTKRWIQDAGYEYVKKTFGWFLTKQIAVLTAVCFRLLKQRRK